MDKLTDLKAFIESHGGYVSPYLYRRELHGVQGLFASETLSVGEQLFVIPSELCLTPERYGRCVESRKYRLTGDVDKVVVQLLVENARQGESIYWPWIRRLPTLEQFRAFLPYLCSTDERAAVAESCPRIGETIEKFWLSVQRFQELTGGRFSEEAVLWAYASCMTRAFEGIGLVPGADLLNHSEARGNRIDDDLCMTNHYQVEEGGQVYTTYGWAYDDLELWLNFGFVDVETPHRVTCSNMVLNTSRNEKLSRMLGKLGCVPLLGGESGEMKPDNDAHFTAEGPSSTVLNICQVLCGESGQRPSARAIGVLRQMVTVFRDELRENGLKQQIWSSSPQLRCGRKVIAERLGVLAAVQGWIGRELRTQEATH